MILNIQKKKKENFTENIMIVAIVLSVFKNITDSSAIFSFFSQLNSIILLVFLALMFYKLITQKYQFIQLMGIIVIGLICVYSTTTLKFYTLFYSFLMIICMQKVDLKKLLKASMVTKIVLLIIHVIVFIIMLNFAPDQVVLIVRKGVVRYTFMLGHPNTFTAYLSWTLIEYMYIMYDKLKTWHLAVLWCINWVFYLYTNSNTGMIVVSVIIVLVYLAKREWKIYDSIIRKIAEYMFPVLSGFFYFMIYIFPKLSGGLKDAWFTFNDALTGRLFYGAFALANYGITIFGKNTVYPSKSYWIGYWIDEVYFDNSFLNFYFEMGAIYLLIISIALYFTSRKASIIENVMIIGCILYGVMEGYLINVFVSFPLLLIGKYLYFKKKEELPKKSKNALWKAKK